jgi:hypothetical protein
MVWFFMLAVIASMFVFYSFTGHGASTDYFTSAEMASMAPNRYILSLHESTST